MAKRLRLHNKFSSILCLGYGQGKSLVFDSMYLASQLEPKVVPVPEYSIYKMYREKTIVSYLILFVDDLVYCSQSPELSL